MPEHVSQHGSLSFCAREMPRPSLLAPQVVPHCAPGAVDSAQALALCRATTSAKCTGVRVARRPPWCDCGRQCGDKGGYLQDKSGLHMLGGDVWCGVTTSPSRRTHARDRRNAGSTRGAGNAATQSPRRASASRESCAAWRASWPRSAGRARARRRTLCRSPKASATLHL